MGHLAYVVLSGLTFVLNLGPVYCQFAQGNANSGVICMAFWIMIGLLCNLVRLSACCFQDRADLHEFILRSTLPSGSTTPLSWAGPGVTSP